MNRLFFFPLKKILHDLKNKTNPIKSYNAYVSLAQIFDVNQSWKTTCRRDLLKMIAAQLGHHSKGINSWTAYKKHLQTTFDDIDTAFKNYDLLSLKWLFNEDPASLSWYSYLRKCDFKFNSRLDLLNHYLGCGAPHAI